MLMAWESKKELDSSLRKNENSSVDTNTEQSCSDFWQMAPYSHLSWDEVAHDVARAEYIAVRERLYLACSQVRLELNHIEEVRKMMINHLDHMMEQFVDAFCDYSLVGQCLSGQEEDRFWLLCDDVEDAKEEIRESSRTSVHCKNEKTKDKLDNFLGFF